MDTEVIFHRMAVILCSSKQEKRREKDNNLNN